MKPEEKMQCIQQYVGTMFTGSINWNSLIQYRSIIIKDLSTLLDVKEDYLTLHCDFMRGVKKNNMLLCVDSLYDAVLILSNKNVTL